MIPGVDRTVKCWRLEDNLMSANKLESDQSSPSAGITVGGDGDFKAIENLDEEDRGKKRDKKKKKKNRRFANNSYRMKFILHWDEDHCQKVNVISGFRIIENDVHSNQIFVGDVTSNLTIYTLE